ncbi:MAG: DUF2493 domain-containing protein [Actinomycetia bacterium]|nr:DUF2493 domain-containing protein [Actinomycetes bacterium]
MRLLVCGDRNWTDDAVILAQLELRRPDAVIHRADKGAGKMAGEAAEYLHISHGGPVVNWHDHGREAGSIANQAMIDERPDLVLAFHDDLDTSKVTKDIIDRALLAGVRVLVLSHAGVVLSSGFITVAHQLVEQTPVEAWPWPSGTKVIPVERQEGVDYPGGGDFVFLVAHRDIPADGNIRPRFRVVFAEGPAGRRLTEFEGW